MIPSNTISVYTDGACSGNPGPGGWGVLIQRPNGADEVRLSGGLADTTNNQMELEAAIQALQHLVDSGTSGPVIIHSDSKYVIDGITGWINGWKKNNWITSSKKPVKNKEYWIRLDSIVHRATQAGILLHWQWVKGHANNPGNIAVDALAVSAIPGGLAQAGPQ